MKTALALGTFDGVHIGHRAVLNLPSDHRRIAVIFARPPKAEADPSVKCITTYEEKCRILKTIGIDEIETLDFAQVCDLSPLEFLNRLNQEYSPSVISCGFNYRFGKDASGNAALISDFCRENGITCYCREPVTANGRPVSSTVIRESLKAGEIAAANALLSEPFSYTSVIMDGDHRGRTIGFPTINQPYPSILTPLKNGVYETVVTVEDRQYRGLTNLGCRPTFPTDFIISETYLHGFSGNLYGKTARVEPVRFLREEKKFASVAELKAQIERDLLQITG
ncbi:MAG: riboflavin biosynthesis protein RibF [Clostridia bacterium]|nr:riboflavin biosynthesis protein RibF [Clostridia bacterium]